MCTSGSITPTQAIDNRFQNQINRANWGDTNETMNACQENRLEARDSRIENRAMIDESQNGGQLTSGEYDRLNARLNNVSQSIFGFNQGQFPPSELLPGKPTQPA